MSATLHPDPLSFAASCLYAAANQTRLDLARICHLRLASIALEEAGEPDLARRVRASMQTPCDWDLWDAVCERQLQRQRGDAA